MRDNSSKREQPDKGQRQATSEANVAAVNQAKGLVEHWKVLSREMCKVISLFKHSSNSFLRMFCRGANRKQGEPHQEAIKYPRPMIMPASHSPLCLKLIFLNISLTLTCHHIPSTKTFPGLP